MKTVRVAAAVIKAEIKMVKVIFATERGYGEFKSLGISRRQNRGGRNTTGSPTKRNHGRT